MPNEQFVVHSFAVQETGDVIMWRDGGWRGEAWRNGEWAVSGSDALGFADMLSRPAMLQNPLVLSDPPTLAWRMQSSLSDVIDAVRNHAREKGENVPQQVDDHPWRLSGVVRGERRHNSPAPVGSRFRGNDGARG